jgi:hypothetical protein
MKVSWWTLKVSSGRPASPIAERKAGHHIEGCQSRSCQ